MADKLVIVESPAKANTINKILGKDYVVKSSMGHVRDLPVKTLGVDIEKNFEPKYVVVKGRKKIIDELKSAAKGCDTVYLAPDPDREGEAIAWHLKAILEKGKEKKRFVRVQYNEITPKAVKSAFENPGELDMNRVNAQQARRILDRIVGYTVSPMLWRRLRRGLSAGRVQSVALRLVCERESEIRKFVPEKYWILGAMVRKQIVPLDPFRIKLIRIDGEKADVKAAEDAERISKELESCTLRVSGIAIKEVNRKAPPPYITSTLQQAGSSYCGFSPKRTMSIAQRLYEGVDIGGERVGLITYMRTDSLSVSSDALEGCRGYIADTYGDAYLPEKPNRFKSRKSAQEAHEAIRPTDVTRTPDSLAKRLDGPELKLYGLIWRRFVASQMMPAKHELRTVKVDAVPQQDAASRYLLQASASEVKFPGYTKVSGAEDKSKAKDKEDETQKLPQLAEGEPLQCLEWLSDEKETQPPTRYSEASLVRALEVNGVGRPSTYAATVSTLYARKYIDREKRSLAPTDLGMEVNGILVEDLGELFDVGFTAAMEESLDEVEDGAVDWTTMLGSFYEKFEKWMSSIQIPTADSSEVMQVIGILQGVTEWAPEVKRGKRIFSDKRFADSLQKQCDKGEKPISERQFTTLLKIAYRYRDQVAGIEQLIKDLGRGEILEDPNLKPPKEETVRKLELLKDLPMNASAGDFVGSLRARVEAGRRLSEAQGRALNNVVMSHAAQIPDFEAIKDSLDIGQTEVTEDTESKPLLEGLSVVKTWNEPVTRGKRVFDDNAFYTSLTDHFGRKGFLSVRQRAALKKMVVRYRDQIPNYSELESQFGLQKPKPKGKKKRS